MPHLVRHAPPFRSSLEIRQQSTPFTTRRACFFFWVKHPGLSQPVMSRKVQPRPCYVHHRVGLRVLQVSTGGGVHLELEFHALKVPSVHKTVDTKQDPSSVF